MKPNLFLIGAPKCGTTALADYLNQHPDVGMCHFKEPFYFAKEFKKQHKIDDIEAYKNLFNNEVLSKKIVFEGSTHYLMSNTAIDNILKFNPEAKFICMVRNPFEMIPSWHDELVYQGHQKGELNCALEKSVSMHISLKSENETYMDESMMYDYLYVASNGHHIQRLLTKVKKERIKFIHFDDFISDTENQFMEICDFLNIKQKAVEFKKVNARKYHKFPGLVSAIRKVAKGLGKIGVKNLGVGKKLVSAQLDNNKKERVVNYSQYIIDNLNEDVDLIKKYTELDVEKWKIEK